MLEAIVMQIVEFDTIYATRQFKEIKAVISIGVYDGFHYGHQRIINHTVKGAKERENCKAVVFTFAQNPKTIVGRNPFKKPLMSERQKVDYFTKLGVDFLVVIDFSVDISKLTGEAFIQRCCSMFDIQSVVVGEGFRCGHKADTGVNELKEIVPRICNNATVEVPDTYKLSDGTVDSSTLVRESLTQGKVAQIIGQLGRYYILDLHSMVVSLEHSSLQFSVESALQLLPPPGLYETVVTLKNGLKVPTETTIDEINITIKSQMEALKSYDYLEFIKELT